MKKRRFSKWIIFAMTSALLLVSLLFFVSGNREAARQLANFPAAVLAQFTSFMRLPVDLATDFGQEVTDLFQAYNENKSLKQRLSTLENQDRIIERLENDNATLREALSIKKEISPQQLLSARVIYRSTLSWLEMVTLDKGAKDQVTSHMLAVTDKGLVGTISQLNDTTSQVELLTNTARQTAIGARIETASGILYGMVLGYDTEKEALKLSQFNQQLPIKVGDKVLTSGLDGTGLEGITIGQVKEIARTEDQALMAYVTPAVNNTSLTSVTLIGEGGND
ncbi:rod shape-determining protein MreC [Streptococcus entericus]|uniref:rod shape-determining protein MreC n=1 Tax=Streptococcus entericus TaxID=155680 RepID=UPI0003665C5A|nr:rod shape-determining protein MreC [Streptococcus entericus]